MLRLHIEGEEQQVQPFLFDLKQHPNMDLIEKEVAEAKEEVKVKCMVKHEPNRRMKVVALNTVDGKLLQIPVMDAILVKLEEKITLIAGRSFDIFG